MSNLFKELKEIAREWIENEGQMTDHIDDYIEAFIAGNNHAKENLQLENLNLKEKVN